MRNGAIIKKAAVLWAKLEVSNGKLTKVRFTRPTYEPGYGILIMRTRPACGCAKNPHVGEPNLASRPAGSDAGIGLANICCANARSHESASMLGWLSADRRAMTTGSVPLHCRNNRSNVSQHKSSLTPRACIAAKSEPTTWCSKRYARPNNQPSHSSSGYRFTPA